MRHLMIALLLSVLPSAWPAALAPPASPAAFSSVQDGFIRDPEVAARKMYDAWQAKNQKAAAEIAEAAAVTKLFGLTVQPLTFTHCQRTGDGVFECVYHDAKTNFEVWFRVIGGASAGYHVGSVSFSTD